MNEGKHRHPHTVRMGGVVALCVALAAVVALLTAEPGEPPRPATEVRTLSEAYPQVTLVRTPASLADGMPYNPMFFVDAQRSIGTAPTDDGEAVRLLLRSGETERELRRLDKNKAAEFGGFTTDGTTLAWLELTSLDDGTGEARIWATELAGGKPRMVTTDIGNVMLFDRQDDMVMHDDSLTWVAGVDNDPLITEVRTVKLTGGKVTVQTIDGPYAFASWPWLTSVNPANDGPIEMRNLLTDERTVVGQQPGELMACSAVWCRAVILGSDENSTVIEMVRPDGKDRFRTITGSVAASIVDVAVLDRYELYSRGNSAATVANQLLLYDLEKREPVLVTEGAGQVLCRNGVLWWSSGDNETLVWNSISLAELAGLG